MPDPSPLFPDWSGCADANRGFPVPQTARETGGHADGQGRQGQAPLLDRHGRNDTAGVESKEPFGGQEVADRRHGNRVAEQRPQRAAISRSSPPSARGREGQVAGVEVQAVEVGGQPADEQHQGVVDVELVVLDVAAGD